MYLGQNHKFFQSEHFSLAHRYSRLDIRTLFISIFYHLLNNSVREINVENNSVTQINNRCRNILMKYFIKLLFTYII